MFAYLKNNKKGDKDIIIAQMIVDDKLTNMLLSSDKVPNHSIKSFVYQAMNSYYSEDGLLFNNFADIKTILKGDLLNNLYTIKGWLNYSNEKTSKIRIEKINSDFAKLYYDILPYVKLQEVEKIPMLKLPIVVNSLDVSRQRKQEIYRDVLVSAMNNEQFLSVLNGHIKIDKKKNTKVKVK